MRPRTFFGMVAIVLLPMFLSLSNGRVCFAQTATRTLKVDVQPFPGVYRINVATSDNKPVISDLVLQVVCRCNAYQGGPIKYSKELVIKSGKTSAIVELACHSISNEWRNVQIVVEDNDNERYDSQDYMRTSVQPTNNWYDLDNHLFVSSNIASIPGETVLCSKKGQSQTGANSLGVTDPKLLPNFQTLLPLYETYGGISSGSVTDNLSFLQNASNYISCIHTSDFFEDWISLSHFRAVFISTNDFRLLAKSKNKLKALTQWISAGGQLVVFDCDQKFKERNSIFKMLVENDVSVGATHWQSPNESIKNIDGFAVENDWASSQNHGLVDVSTLPGIVIEKTESYDDQPLLVHDFLLGHLILVRKDSKSWTTNEWQLLHNTLHQISSVSKVFGGSNLEGRFHQSFRIPGIGNPPVVAFQILIALFVILIGPGFYFFFKATGRLYLLLVSTPLLSLFAVVSLFAYAIISDGFAIQGRIETITVIDHRSRAAVSHARQAFYSGVSPKPCVFEENSLVTCNRTNHGAAVSFRDRNKRLSVSGGQIKARTPFQITSLRCFETEKRIRFAVARADSESGIVTNEYDNKILLAVVHVNDGCFLARDVEPLSTSMAIRVDWPKARAELYQFFRSNDVSQPNENYRPHYDYYGYLQDDSWGFTNDFPAALKSNNKLSAVLPINSYVLITDGNEMVDNPQPDTIYGENRRHVIVGKW